MPLVLPVALPALVDTARRVAATGLGALAALVADPGRTEGTDLATLDRRVTGFEARLEALETSAEDLRAQVDSLIAQLNERLLPGLDERMDETERDLTKLATALVMADKAAGGRERRLGNAELRVADLRDKVGRLEQRTGLWRQLQADVARISEDLEAVRARTLVEQPQQ